MPVDPWNVRPIRLPYRVGSIRLTYLSLPFAVYDRHFTKLTSDPDAVEVPFHRWDDEVQGALIMSHPVATTPSRITVLGTSIRYVPGQHPRYLIDLKTSFDTYLEHFSPKTRATLRRKIRRFTQRSGGAIDLREYRAPEDMPAFHHAARQVAVTTYQEHLLHNAIPDGAEFLADLQELAGQGRVRGYILSLEGRPIAYLYCPIWDDAVIYEYVGHDPACQDLSPGTVLQHLALERLFAERAFDAFDFTEGEGQHKSLFATHRTLCADLFYFRKNARNASIISGHYACAELTRGASAVLDLLDLRDRARRYLRSVPARERHASEAPIEQQPLSAP